MARPTGYRLLSATLLAIFALIACGGPEGLRALGTIERERIVLKATAGEIITALPVAEGQYVARGTLLVALDRRRQNARVSAATAELARADAQLQLLRNGARVEDIDAARARLEGADAALRVAEKSFQRARELRAKQLNSQADLDRARAERDAALASEKTAAKQLLALTNGTRKEELDQAEAALAAARAQLQLEQLQLDELEITATRDGYLDSLPWNLGERVAPGATVAVLLADEAPFARVYIPEPWRTRLQVGDSVAVVVDGRAQEYAGVVRWLAAEPAFSPYFALNERDRARLMYLAEVDLEQGADLPTGVPAEVRKIGAHD